MTRTAINLTVDVTAAVSLLGMVATGYILRYPLPDNTHKTHTLWGFTRGQWGDAHYWASVGLLAVLLAHLVLHWRWVVGTLGRRLGADPGSARHAGRVGLAILAGVAAALIGFGWAAHRGVRPIPGPGDDYPPPRAGGDVNFWKDVYPVFERSCLSCHGPRRPSGGFRADRRESLIGPDPDDRWVMPGDSAHSPLLGVVSGTRPGLPYPDRHRLADAERDLIRRWIDAGAPWPDRPQ
jgi:mono/diheme cytochrome c family protein